MNYSEVINNPKIFALYLLEGEKRAKEAVIKLRYKLFEDYGNENFVNYVIKDSELKRRLDDLIQKEPEFNKETIAVKLYPEYQKKVESFGTLVKKAIDETPEYIGIYNKQGALSQKDALIEDFIKDYYERYPKYKNVEEKKPNMILYLDTLVALSKKLKNTDATKLGDKETRLEIENYILNKIRNYKAINLPKNEEERIVKELTIGAFVYAIETDLNKTNSMLNNLGKKRG